MKYQILFERKAVKQLTGISQVDVSKIKENIRLLGENPRPSGYIKLKGEEAYRIRIGVYRVIYEIIDNLLIVKIIAVAHRKEVYK